MGGWGFYQWVETVLQAYTRWENTALKSLRVTLIKKGKKVILTGKGKVEVYDPSGRLIGRFTVDGHKEIHLKSGVYMFRIDGKIRKEIVR